MKRIGWAWVMVLGLITAKGWSDDKSLNAQEQLGRRLFEQSCGVCHTKPTLISGTYGPELSRLNLGGQEELLRLFISNGTPRMPGFKYTFTPEQIAAIASYIKTIAPPVQENAAAKPAH